jgi:glycosyltransferase involved in cell wall biosynthesis
VSQRSVRWRARPSRVREFIATAHRAMGSRATDGESKPVRGAAEVAIVLFSGQLGGAETFSASLAAQLPDSGVRATVVLIDGRGPLPQRLDALGVPYAVYGAKRGREVVYRPRRFAKLVNECGQDAAILGWPGYLAGALRLGGYRGAVIAVEHGAQLVEDRNSWFRRIYKSLDWRMGLWATDQHVAVSKFACERLCRSPHKGTPVVIYNGVDMRRYRVPAQRDRRAREGTVVGVTSRLDAGKGIDVLLRAMRILKDTNMKEPVHLLVAGGGPERQVLERLAVSLQIENEVSMVGWVEDLPAFWQQCDVAAVPSTSTETFGMAAVEPMACGLPVVATRNGGLCEVVDDGVTGLMVPPGDAVALAAALQRYALDQTLRLLHGAAARKRCERDFDMRSAARAYAGLIMQQTENQPR